MDDSVLFSGSSYFTSKVKHPVDSETQKLGTQNKSEMVYNNVLQWL